MSTSFLVTLLSFLSTHASGVLAGVIGAKLSAWIADHVKTQAEKALYTDLLLPLFQSLTGVLQSVPVVFPAAAASVEAPAAPIVVPAGSQTAAAAVSIPVYNQD